MPGDADREPGILAVSLAREAVERYVQTGCHLEPPPDLPHSWAGPALHS